MTLLAEEICVGLADKDDVAIRVARDQIGKLRRGSRILQNVATGGRRRQLILQEDPKRIKAQAQVPRRFEHRTQGRVVDFSGFRLGLPPVTVVNWKLQAGLLGSNFGHLIGSRVPFEVTLVACAAYRSVKEGARKPEPAEARSNHIHRLKFQ